MRKLLFTLFISLFFQNAEAFGEKDSVAIQKSEEKVEIFKVNQLLSLDSALVHTTLLDPEEDLFTPSFFAVNSGLYKFPVLLNTNDFGWVSKHFMMTLDSLNYDMDTVPVLTAKYDHGFPSTHWFTADFKRAIGKSKLSAKFNRNASEPLYNNTRAVRNNFGFGAELPFRKNWGVKLAYFRNQASINENGGIYNKDSLAVVEEFTVANIFSNLNTAQNNVFEQKAILFQEFKLFNKLDSANLKRRILNFELGSSVERNKYDFSLEERDIDSAFFDNNFLDTTATFDSVGFEKIAIEPSLVYSTFKNDVSQKIKIGAKKEWHNYDFLNNSYAFLSSSFNTSKSSYGAEYQYHFENFWEGNYNIKGYAFWKLPKAIGKDSTVYQTNLKVNGSYGIETPSYLFLNYFGNHHQWSNSFTPIQRLKFNSKLDLTQYNSIIDVELQQLGNYIYLDAASTPQQLLKAVTTAKVHVKNELGNNWLKLYTGIIYQYSSSDVIRVPNLVARTTLSFNFKYRTVPFTLGSTISYFSKYTGLNYNPAIRHYHLGTQEVGGTPVVDWFFAGRIGPADLYVKYDNSFYLLNRQLFLGENYPIYKQYLRFGLKWKLKN